MSGKITKVFSTKDYEVLLDNGITIKAFTSGKMTLHNIKMIPGDVVDVELSPYDMSKGRIVYRLK
nr:translation initiation factor IF-1 [Metamycoplasma hyosynoviae]